MNFPPQVYVVVGSCLVVAAFYLVARHIWLRRLARAHACPNLVNLLMARSPIYSGGTDASLAAWQLFIGYYDGDPAKMALIQVATTVVAGGIAVALFAHNSTKIRRALVR